MERCDDHQRMRQHFVHFFHIVGKDCILEPRRRNGGKTEQRQCITARKLEDNPGDWHRDEQRVRV